MCYNAIVNSVEHGVKTYMAHHGSRPFQSETDDSVVTNSS